MRTIGSREVYRNGWMSVREDRVLRADGSAGIYGVVDKADFALVIPQDDDGFWLVEQYRYPVRRRAWEFPQGSWGPGASGDLEQLAAAELREETGLEALVLRHLGHLYGAYGFCSQGFDVYLATGLRQGPPAREASEQDMRHRLVSEDELVAMIRNGQVVDGATVAAYGLVLLAESAGTVHAGDAAEGVPGMADEDEQRVADEPAGWALDQARDELDDDAEPGAVRQRAEELLREAQERDDERHDEYDDPDQGGEA